MHLVSVDPDSTFGDRKSIQPEVSNIAAIRVMVLAARREPLRWMFRNAISLPCHEWLQWQPPYGIVAQIARQVWQEIPW